MIPAKGEPNFKPGDIVRFIGLDHRYDGVGEQAFHGNVGVANYYTGELAKVLRNAVADVNKVPKTDRAWTTWEVQFFNDFRKEWLFESEMVLLKRCSELFEMFKPRKDGPGETV